MKINQYCSVCKKHLDMEVIPTDDGGDDGVIWLRCPECQGFLPKFSGEGLKTEPAPAPEAAREPAASPSQTTEPGPAATREPEAVPDDDEDEAAPKVAEEAAPEAEPVAEYAALLAEADTTQARPYRSTQEYAVGDVVHHLAYGDVGIVVDKVALPGGRRAVKVYFEETGVVHLIEQESGGR